MRVMTPGAFQPGIVLIRVDAFDLRSLTGRIGKVGMAPEAEASASVQGQFRGVGGVLKSRSMTIFALDGFMRGRKNLFFFVGMAVPAVFLPLIFYFDGFPFRWVPRTVPAVHVPALMDSKVFGDEESPGGQDDHHQGQNHIQGPQYMHGRTPTVKTQERLFFPYRGTSSKDGIGYGISGLAAAFSISLSSPPLPDSNFASTARRRYLVLF